MYIFSIYDVVAEDWSTPFCAKNTEHLKRVLSGVFNRGTVLDDCYVLCLGSLQDNGEFMPFIKLFEGDLYLSKLFAEELEEREKLEGGKND